MPQTWFLALAGGGLIGAAAALLFAAHGRIAGVSGIVGALLPPRERDPGWRVAFLIGLIAAGAVASVVAPDAVGSSPRSLGALVMAGLLVGYGTRLGGGCTSGHGVCGVARLSVRSIAAVATFLLTGAITAWVVGP
ncbi:MAG TPA: YeeE/YedE thiosulfate transporter family protein [Kofleriaceae bacterium]|nr:YeeE/YedE thiosulfate transporter family protein [Kofleriaceae bacterium]